MLMRLNQILEYCPGISYGGDFRIFAMQEIVFNGLQIQLVGMPTSCVYLDLQ